MVVVKILSISSSFCVKMTNPSFEVVIFVTYMPFEQRTSSKASFLAGSLEFWDLILTRAMFHIVQCRKYVGGCVPLRITTNKTETNKRNAKKDKLGKERTTKQNSPKVKPNARCHTA